MTFPPRPVRDVRVRYIRPSCQGGTADITVDFEPLPGGALGFEFVDAVDWTGTADELITAEELRDCVDRAREGILLTLLGMPGKEPGSLTQALNKGVALCGDARRPLIAARVVLRHARYHIVDSHPAIFRRAGCRAAHKAIRRIDGTPPDRDPRDMA